MAQVSNIKERDIRLMLGRKVLRQSLYPCVGVFHRNRDWGTMVVDYNHSRFVFELSEAESNL